MGVLDTVKQVVFIVDTSSALSGLFNMLVGNYLVPYVEYFNGGPIDISQGSSGNHYGLITVNPSPLFSVPSCDYWPITNNSKTLIQYFKDIKFEGGLIEHCCRVSDGLAAALEFLDLMEKFAQKNDQTDVKFERYCVLITNLPPSPMPVVESLKFGGMSYLQLAEHMAANNVNLSVISPRWLAPYKDMFMKGSQLADVSVADHSLHPGCMVLLHGLELTGVKAMRSKNDSDSTLEDVRSIVPPSPSLSTLQGTPGSVGSTHQANTSSPSEQLTTTANTTTDKSPLAKTSSASSLVDPNLWVHSPKVLSNPASVPMTSSGFTHGTGDVPSLPISHTPSPQSVPSFSSTGGSTFTGGLNLSAHDTLGSYGNPIQITSPIADGSLAFQPSSTAPSNYSLASLMSPATLPSVTSPPFGMSSSLTSSMAPPTDISTSSSVEQHSVASTVSNISSLLLANPSATTANPLVSTQVPVRAPLSSQTPPPSTQGGAAAVAAQILRQATIQANKQNPAVGTGLPLSSAPNVSATTGTGFPQNPSSLAPIPNPPISVTPPTGAGLPSAAPQPPVQQSQIWSGILETFETRANNQKHPRPVQCGILVSKAETTQEIKPELWPSKLSMSIHTKNLFNNFTMFFRQNHNLLRTVHFQFLERPEGVPMLRALMNNDLPQNKKIGIVQLSGGSPLCHIKAFFIICQEKGSSKQFTGLIPLDQEKFIPTLRQALAFQQRQAQQPQAGQRLGTGMVGNNPMMQHVAQGGTMATSQTQLDSQPQGGNSMFMTPGQQQGMTSQGQQQNYPSMSMMNAQTASQQNYSMSTTGLHQSQQIRPTMQGMGGVQQGMGGVQQGMGGVQQGMGGVQQGMSGVQQGMGGVMGAQQSMGGVQQGMGGTQQQMGGGMGAQQQMGGSQQQQMGGSQQLLAGVQQQMSGGQHIAASQSQQYERVKQALENATPEKRQMIYAKLEQQHRAMRQQQLQQQQLQQQQQQGHQQHFQQYSNMPQHMQQQSGTRPLQQQQPQGGGSGQQQGGSSAGTLDFFNSLQ